MNDLDQFDVADHLDSDAAIAAYLADFLTEENPEVLKAAIKHVVRALDRRQQQEKLHDK